MNILLLGGTGYLGEKVIGRLLTEDHTIVCTKRKSSNISRFKDKTIKWVLDSDEEIARVIENNAFDCVINLVCAYGDGIQIYDKLIESNLQFPLKVLNIAANAGIKRFITIGTGIPDYFNMYSFTKKMFGEFGQFYSSKQGIDFYDLKVEMFYGADEPPERFLSIVINKMLNDEVVNITLGTQKRDIIFVDDVVNAVVGMLDADLKGYQLIPVGSGVAPSISEVVDYIREITGSSSVINKGAVPMRNGEPDCIADISKISKLLVWNPVFWKDGIYRMITEMKTTVFGGV